MSITDEVTFNVLQKKAGMTLYIDENENSTYIINNYGIVTLSSVGNGSSYTHSLPDFEKINKAFTKYCQIIHRYINYPTQTISNFRLTIGKNNGKLKIIMIIGTKTISDYTWNTTTKLITLEPRLNDIQLSWSDFEYWIECVGEFTEKIKNF